jgi:GNAT superfamily N-acetyltransferase
MSEYTIGLSKREDVDALPEIERRAASLFSPEDLAPELAAETTPVLVYLRAHDEGRLIVARDASGRVVGFAHLVWLGEFAHLEEIDVDSDFGRRGIGRMLVEAACEWARAKSSDRITLSTFRDVAWNAPFYARLGFRTLFANQLIVALRDLRAKERGEGLDLNKRVVMCRSLM